jgi:hypothetical protein
MDFLVADEVNVSWESENIPDEDSLWMRVHRMWFDAQGNVLPGSFQNRPTAQDGMSTDWQKYANPEYTRSRAKKPQDNAVIRLVVGEVRQLPNQSVVHTPDSNNRAHTDVFGEKHPEVRVKLARMCRIVIPL